MSRNMITNYLFNKYPFLFYILIAILILIPVTESVSKWGEHPKKLVCTKESDRCNLITYSYKHSICWETLLSRRHRHLNKCSLPKSVTSENEVYNLSKIQDVTVNADIGYFGVYLVNNNGTKRRISGYKKEDTAHRVAKGLKASISGWQNSEESAYEMLHDDKAHTFEYDL